jgi:hypothetical protein
MSVTLVDNTAKILQFKSKNNRDTIEALKELLTLAESVQLCGIAAVKFGVNKATCCFVIGEACESVTDTIDELDKLQRRLVAY